MCVSRYCEGYNIKFSGFYGGFKGEHTRCILVCEEGHTSNNTTVVNLLRGMGGCITCRNNLKPNLKDDIIVIAEFNYPKGTTFKRSPLKGSYWDLYCPVCSIDEYVSAGVCTGVFTSWVSNLKKEAVTCRCSKSYNWTQEQREYQIRKVCIEEDLTFSEWSEGHYINGSYKFNWKCKYGHECTTSVNKFLYGRQRCRTCADNEWGFYKHRMSEIDTLYLLSFYDKISSERFIKIGRTFNLRSRLASFPKNYFVTVLSTIELQHSEVYKLEKTLHKDLYSYRHLPLTHLDGYTECYREEVLSLHNNQILHTLKNGISIKQE